MTAATSGWPGESSAAIALAARVAMLSAASTTCKLTGRSRHQTDLLHLVRMATEVDNVDGQDFPKFLESAKREVLEGARLARLERGAGDALAHIESCEPVDLIARLYDDLVALASDVYRNSFQGERFAPTLNRIVIATEMPEREKPVSGHLLREAEEVDLIIYSSEFDLKSLALVARILVHELICHVGARGTGYWDTKPDPDVRDYFSDGFMDRVAYRLLNDWMIADMFPSVTPVSEFGATEWEFTAERRDAFKDGAAAFEHCVHKTAVRIKCEEPPPTNIASKSVEASINTALRLNAYGSPVTHLDWFAYYARGDERDHAATFADVAASGREPIELIDLITR